MTDTTLHELCKGYGALLSRSKTPQFAEEARRANDRGNLPLHAACSFQATRDAVDALLRAHPPGAAHPNGVGNLPLHQAAMWQAPSDVVELLLSHHPGGASCRNSYGSLPLHLAAGNDAGIDVIRLLVDAYPDALHLQNGDGMTPLDLYAAGRGGGGGGGGAPDGAVVAVLEGRPPPPDLTPRQKAERYMERADELERRAASIRGTGGRRAMKKGRVGRERRETGGGITSTLRVIVTIWGGARRRRR